MKLDVYSFLSIKEFHPSIDFCEAAERVEITPKTRHLAALVVGRVAQMGRSNGALRSHIASQTSSQKCLPYDIHSLVDHQGTFAMLGCRKRGQHDYLY
jgi:hypothetical protein